MGTNNIAAAAPLSSAGRGPRRGGRGSARPFEHVL